MTIYTNRQYVAAWAFIILLFTSCRKLVEIPQPSTQLTLNNVFSTDAGALSAMSAIYAQLASSGNFYAFILCPTNSSDELTAFSTSGSYAPFYQNALAGDNSVVQNNIWNTAYNDIFRVNAVLEGLNNNGISDPVRQQLTGEAKFTRAYFYFFLVNFFGDIPYVSTTDYQTNSVLPRLPKDTIYQRIIDDLEDAKSKLNVNFTEPDGITSKPATERLRPTSMAASALLARVRLYTGDWVNAENEAGRVIGNSMFSLPVDLNQVFIKNSPEAIWQIGRPDGNTYAGSNFVYAAGVRGDYAISQFLLDAFELGDKRRDNWIATTTINGITYDYPYKYKVRVSATVTEYETILRLSEQYLVRAEAKARQDRVTGTDGALTDLNAIRHRAGLLDYAGLTDKNSVLTAIWHERQVELFTEGDRWIDLKRTGMIDAVMSVATPAKGGGTWKTTQQLYPIPVKEILANPHLTPNPGY